MIATVLVCACAAVHDEFVLSPGFETNPFAPKIELEDCTPWLHEFGGTLQPLTYSTCQNITQWSDTRRTHSARDEHEKVPAGQSPRPYPFWGETTRYHPKSKVSKEITFVLAVSSRNSGGWFCISHTLHMLSWSLFLLLLLLILVTILIICLLSSNIIIMYQYNVTLYCITITYHYNVSL